MASELGVQTIQHTNGTDALTIDSSGNVTTQGAFYPNGLTYWPAFLASGSNSAAWRAYNNGEILQFNDVTTGSYLFDHGSDYNTSTYTYTCPVDGLYSFSMQVYTLSDESEGNAVFYVNNLRVEGASSLHVQTREDANQDNTGNQTIVLSLSANDTVQVRTNNAAEFFIQHSFFAGHLIAPT